MASNEDVKPVLGKLCDYHRDHPSRVGIIIACIYPHKNDPFMSNGVTYDRDLRGFQGHSVIVKYNCCSKHAAETHIDNSSGSIGPTGSCGPSGIMGPVGPMGSAGPVDCCPFHKATVKPGMDVMGCCGVMGPDGKAAPSFGFAASSLSDIYSGILASHLSPDEQSDPKVQDALRAIGGLIADHK